MSSALATIGSHPIDHDAVLQAVGLNARDPNAQALLLVCERYGLDPLLKHMVLIQQRPYVTRDGYLHIAHTSGLLDGIEIVEEGETSEHWWAVAAVYRKDMTRPFRYRGRYPKSGAQGQKYGPEMAIKCAEVAALRRAFDVTGVPAADEQFDVDSIDTVDAAVLPAADTTAAGPQATPPALRAAPAIDPDVQATHDARSHLITRFAGIPDARQRAGLKAAFVAEFGRPDALTVDGCERAGAWLDEQLDAGVVVVGDGSLGEHPGADRHPGAGGESPRLPAPTGALPSQDTTMPPAGEGTTPPPDARVVAIMLAQAGLGASAQRHAFIAAATAGVTTSSEGAAATPETARAVRAAALDLYHGRVILDTSGDSPRLVTPDGEFPAYLDGHDAVAAVPLSAQDYWELRLVGIRGIGPAKLLRAAREEARRAGLPEPADLSEIPDDRKVREPLLRWLASEAARAEAAGA